MESYRDIYRRFIENYRTETGGINLYPQFDDDLDYLLEWLENDDAMADWTPDGEYVLDIEADCSWRAPEGDE
jgi:hypothetical protein